MDFVDARKHACAHVLLFAQSCEIVSSMESMARTRTPTNITIDPDVLAAVDQWVANAEPRTTRSAFFEMAAKHFLAAEEKVAKERREK